MKPSLTLILFVLLIISCTKETKEPTEEEIIQPWANSFLSFSINDTFKNFYNFIPSSGFGSGFITNDPGTNEDDTIMVDYVLNFDDTTYANPINVVVSFRQFYKANELENIDYNTGELYPEYELTLNEIMEAFKVGKYRNVLHSNIILGENYIRLRYSVSPPYIYYNYYFSNGYMEEPENEHYFEIHDVDILDDSSFIVRGKFSGDENNFFLSDTNRITNGTFEGYYYNSKNSLCE